MWLVIFSWFVWLAWLCSLNIGLRILIWLWCYIVFEWMSLVGFIVWMYYLISWWVYVMVYFPCMWWCIFCWQYVILMGCIMGVFCLVETLGGIKCCVRFSVPRNPVKTLLPVWRSGKGYLVLCEAVVEDWFECCTLSPEWSSGEGVDVSPYFGSLRVYCPMCDALTFLLIISWGIRETVWLR